MYRPFLISVFVSCMPLLQWQGVNRIPMHMLSQSWRRMLSRYLKDFILWVTMPTSCRGIVCWSRTPALSVMTQQNPPTTTSWVNSGSVWNSCLLSSPPSFASSINFLLMWIWITHRKSSLCVSYCTTASLIMTKLMIMTQMQHHTRESWPGAYLERDTPQPSMTFEARRECWCCDREFWPGSTEKACVARTTMPCAAYSKGTRIGTWCDESWWKSLLRS